MSQVEVCEQCHRPMQVYRTHLRATQLGNLYRLAEFLYANDLSASRVAHIPNISKQGYTEFCKLKYWDLIAPGPEAHTWQITTHGYRFLAGKLTLPEYLWVFFDQVHHSHDYPPGRQVHVWDIAPDVMSKERALEESVKWSVFCGDADEQQLELGL